MEFPSINFSKETEFINEFDDRHSDASLFFNIICTREVPWKKAKAGKNAVL